MQDWRITPTSIDSIDILKENITHISFFDENGSSDMDTVKKSIDENKTLNENEIYFNVTAVTIESKDITMIGEKISSLKSKYWQPDGKCQYRNGDVKKVVFHSREIRRSEGPFSKNVIDYNCFLSSLSELIESIPIVINTSFINKQSHYLLYGMNCQMPYDISLMFILERIVNHVLKDSDKVIIILESRGKKEDMQILLHINKIITFGTYYVTSRQFNKIKGIYFNKKRTADNALSYFGLEIADLCSYPIYRYCINRESSRSFDVIEHKLHAFPNYWGKGLKKFP